MYDWNSNSIVLPLHAEPDLYGSHKRATSVCELMSEVAKSFETNNVVSWISKAPSIWPRDYLPIPTENGLLLFNAATDYMTSEEAAAVIDYQARLRDFCTFLEHFSRQQMETLTLLGLNDFRAFLNRPLRAIDLTLDGGNVVMNSSNVVITTKVFKDNPHLGRTAIESQLRNLFNSRQIIFIDPEPGEPTGHADGMVRFLSNEVLLVNDLEPINRELWRSNLAQLKKSRVEIVRLPYNPTDRVLAGWPVMDGCYINFAATKDQILLSMFDDQATEEKVSEVITSSDALRRPISFLRTTTLDELGGGLHCATWNG